MGIKYFVEGKNMRIVDINDDTAFDKLPAKVYSVGADIQGLFLSIVSDKLVVPSKVYGNTIARAEKILTSYNAREKSTGVLLTGTKGSGKTMLAAVLGNKMIDDNLPVILVNAAYGGDAFVNFINNIGECILIFDEFVKTYSSADEDYQESLLTLLDGNDARKRLVVLTENKERDINDYMLNRPGRIFYHFRYNKLDEDSITGYCEDKKINEDTIKELIELSREMQVFSFDIMQAVVEEYLRFGGSVKDIIGDLNIEYNKNATTRLMIQKVVNKSTGVELKVPTKFKFIDKPDYNSGSSVVFKRENQDSDNKISESQDLEDSENQDLDSVYVHRNDEVYSADDVIVYDTDYYVVYCRVLETQFYDYSKAF